MLTSIGEHAWYSPQLVGFTWIEVALLAAHGLVAHAKGDFKSANPNLATATPKLQGTGGSHVLRDFFVQTRIDNLGELNLGDEVLELILLPAKSRPQVS